MILYINTPSKKQQLFLLSDKKIIAFGGARGGGKSWAVQTKATLLALQYAGIDICIVRKTYPELYNNHIKVMRPKLLGIATYNTTEKEFRFRNGSRIKFQYCRNDKDLENFQGVEFDIIFVDEATQLTEFQIKAIIASLRGTNSFPKRVYLTCNPGGPGHQYIKRLFIDRVYEDGEDPDDYEFIQAFVQDNDALMKSQPGYIKQLEALPYRLREAWLYGKWDVFEGQFFSEFENHPERGLKNTHVIKPLPAEAVQMMNIYRSYDFGYSKPFSCGWWGVNGDGTLFRLLELYGCTKEPNTGVKWTAEEQFKKIKEIELEHPYLKGKKIQGVADPAIWEKSVGPSIYETATKNQIYFTKGDNKRIPGWMQVRYRLQFDENGYPGMYVFENCKGFIRTIPLLEFDPTRVEDLDTEGEDHIADETRYMCMTRPIKPRKQKEPAIIADDPLNMLSGGKR